VHSDTIKLFCLSSPAAAENKGVDRVIESVRASSLTNLMSFNMSASADDFVPGGAPNYYAWAGHLEPGLGAGQGAAEFVPGLGFLPALHVRSVLSTCEAFTVTTLKGRELEMVDTELATREIEAIAALEELAKQLSETKAELAEIRQKRQNITSEIECREEVGLCC